MSIQLIGGFYFYTNETAVGIFVPPAAPTIKRTAPFASVTMVGDIDDCARFCGAIKLPGDDGRSKIFFMAGTEKSFIPVLNMMPVRLPASPIPKLMIV